MQKVVDFLEKYCQWLAVGIAALFFLFALYTFLPGVSTPVVATVDGAPLPPGDVDERIVESVVNPLSSKISANEKIPDKVPAYGRQFTDSLQVPPKVATLPAEAIAIRPIEYPKDFKIEDPKDGGGQEQGPGLVQALPKLAQTLVLEPEPTTGFAQVLVNAPAPGAPPVAPPAPPVAGQPAVPPPPTKDVTWVRVPFTISMQRVRMAFQAEVIPANLQTGVLRVELVRQRQLAGDAWDVEEVVPAFTAGTPYQSMPPAGAPLLAFDAFKNWAFQNQQPILQPLFFTLYGGEDPTLSKPIVAAPAAVVFDPETFPMPPAPGSDVSKLTPEEREAVRKVRARKAQEAAAARRGAAGAGGNRGTRPPRGAGGGMPEGMERIELPQGIVDPSQPVKFQYPRPGGRPPGLPTAPPPGYPGMGDETGMDPGTSGVPAAPVAGQPIQLPAPPPAPFIPDPQGQAGMPDIYGYCYDISARSDSTYRYRVRYVLYNPVFNTQNVAVPEVAKKFDIVADDPNTWTAPIAVAPRTYVFLFQQPQSGTSTVRFTVFRWQDGRQHKTTVTASPGDSIGQLDKNIDFRTPWTLVEVRRDPIGGGNYALLMNSEGRLRKRTMTEDQADPLLKKLTADVDAANAAAAGAAAPGAAASTALQ